MRVSRLRHLFLCVALAAGGSCAWASVASAQRTVLLVSSSVEAPVDDALVLALRTQLTTSGAEVVSADALHTLVDERLSREPVAVGADEVGELAAAVRELETLVATRQRETALRQAEHVRTLSEGTVDALAEQRELARTLMNGCLADAWLHLQMDEGDAARDRLRACREMHPDVEVDTRTTPPIVGRLLTEIDAELASRPRRTVRIDTPLTGCDVLLNGRHFGTTPQPLPDVPIGRYQVELACPGVAHHRVHTLVVADEDRSIAIDPGFDDALRSDGDVRFVYATAAAEGTSRLDYAQRVATVASATEVILLTRDGAATRVDRVSLARGVIASVRIDAASDAALAASALIGGRSLDLEGEGQREYAAWSPDPSSARPSVDEDDGSSAASGPAGGHDDGAMIAGIALGSAGALALAGGWIGYGYWQGFYDARSGLDPALSRAYLLSVQIEQAEFAAVSLGIGGATLIAASIPLWLPDDGIVDVGQIPWWSWTIGALGLVAIGIGAGIATTNGQYVQSPNFATCHCLTPQSTMLFSSLFWETGGAALALPITHLLRVAIGPRAPAVQASVASTGVSIGFGGSW